MNARLLGARVALTAVAVIAAAASLTGCSDVERADEAARVDGTVIPAADVDTAVREISANPQLRNVTSYQVAELLVYKAVAAPLAAKSGAVVTNSMVTEKYPAFAGASQPTLDVLGTDMLLSANLQGDTGFAKQFYAAVDKASIEMNPRYGAVDTSNPGKLPITRGTIPWLKGGGVEATPTAAAQG